VVADKAGNKETERERERKSRKRNRKREIWRLKESD